MVAVLGSLYQDQAFWLVAHFDQLKNENKTITNTNTGHMSYNIYMYYTARYNPTKLKVKVIFKQAGKGNRKTLRIAADV